MDSQFSESTTHNSGEYTQAAKAAYYQYALLAEVASDAAKRSETLIDEATPDQAEKLRVAFVSVARTLMEIKGYGESEITEVLGEAIPVEVRAATIHAESLSTSLPNLVLRYIADIAGPVDDIRLGSDHIETIKEVLLSFRPAPRRSERASDPSLLLPEFLGLKLTGIQNDAIGNTYGISGSKVKGVFYRFTQSVLENTTPDQVGEALRAKLAERNLLEPALEKADTVPWIDDIDRSSLKRVSTPRANSTSKPSARRPTVKQSPVPFSPPRLSSLRDTPESLSYTPPDDLLEHETIADRRQRLTNQRSENGETDAK